MAAKSCHSQPPALSIRQPWAWLILHAGKDIENREKWTKNYTYTGRLLIHASKTMTRTEYEHAVEFAKRRGVSGIPSFETMKEKHCGGIVGEVTLERYVTASKSKWYFPKGDGHKGLVLKNPKPCRIKRCEGNRMFFAPELPQ